MESIGVEHRRNRYRKASQHHRRRQLPATIDACFLVSIAAEPQNADRFRLRINNPDSGTPPSRSHRVLERDLVPVSLRSQPRERRQHRARIGFAGGDLSPMSRGEDRAHDTCLVEFAGVRGQIGLDRGSTKPKNARNKNFSTLWCLSVGIGSTSRKPSVNSTSLLRWSCRPRYSSSLQLPWAGSNSTRMSRQSCEAEVRSRFPLSSP